MTFVARSSSSPSISAFGVLSFGSTTGSIELLSSIYPAGFSENSFDSDEKMTDDRLSFKAGRTHNTRLTRPPLTMTFPESPTNAALPLSLPGERSHQLSLNFRTFSGRGLASVVFSRYSFAPVTLTSVKSVSTMASFTPAKESPSAVSASSLLFTVDPL